MLSKASLVRVLARAARRKRSAQPVRLHCQQFEDRITPALFNVQQPIPLPSGLNNSGHIMATDLNRDGRQDIIVTDIGLDFLGQAGNKLKVLYRNPGSSSGWTGPIEFLTGGTNVSFAAAGDINGDGWTDIVATNENNHNAGTFSVFRNDGAGGLILTGTFATFSNNPCWIGLEDVTGDNVLDAVVCSYGKDTGNDNIVGQNITIFQGLTDAQGHGNFTFSASPITTIVPEIQFIPTSLAVADFDGDGILDIAAAVPGVPADSTQPQPNGKVYTFKGTGAGSFTAGTVYDSGGALPVNIQTADLNGDGKKDLILANAGDPNANPAFRSNSVGVLLNTSGSGALSFSVLPTSLTANCMGTFAVAVADYNLDGKMDIASVNFGGYPSLSPPAFVSIYLGNGLGGFSTDSPGMYDTQTLLPGGQYLVAADYDGNGTPDIFVAHASNFIGLLVNTTTPVNRPTVSGVAANGDQTNTVQRSRVTSMTVTFSTQVTFAQPSNIAAAFQLTRLGGGAVGGFTATQAVVAGKTVVTLSGFTGTETEFGSLADGFYRVKVLSAQVSAGGLALDGNGNGVADPTDDYQLDGNTTNKLFRYFGDANGDAAVSGIDFGFFRGCFGLGVGQPGYLDYFDFNGGGIGGADFGQLRLRYGTALPLP